jgi:hypothetical protein
MLQVMDVKADKKTKTPTHYVSLLWFNAFCDQFFDEHMDWMKRNDPIFGAGSYGNITRLVPKHLHIFFKQFGQLKNDGWRDAPAFAKYIEALDLLPEKGEIRSVGKEFFLELPKKFLRRFEQSFRAQIGSWQSSSVICMAVAGHPMIAKWLLNYIFGETTAPADLEIDMAHHYTGRETPKVKVTECIEIFVEQVEDVKDLEFNSFIQDFLREFRIIAEGDGTIDALDKSTWEDHDLSRLEEGIWNCIAPCTAHQQLAENLLSGKDWSKRSPSLCTRQKPYVICSRLQYLG